MLGAVACIDQPHSRIYDTRYGYVEWRRGTGDNLEITHIKASAPGGGRVLLREMLRAVKWNPPYNGNGTVYGFTRVSNERARAWYTEMGFTLTTVVGVYAEGQAVVFSAPYSTLCQLHLTRDEHEPTDSTG